MQDLIPLPMFVQGQHVSMVRLLPQKKSTIHMIAKILCATVFLLCLILVMIMLVVMVMILLLTIVVVVIVVIIANVNDNDHAVAAAAASINEADKADDSDHGR